MKIYLDNCCYNRPFDDQKQKRIHMESEAILRVLEKTQQENYIIVGSAVLELEIEQMHDESKKKKVKSLYRITKIRVPYTADIRKRSQEIMKQSKIRTFDSLHIATAESIAADVMLTTDDKLEKMAARLKLKVKVMNPLKFMKEGV